MRFIKCRAVLLAIMIQVIVGCGGGGGGGAADGGSGDVTAPTVNSFSLPGTASALTVAISSFTASDNIGVTGYLITESPTVPVASASGWTATAPTSFTFSSAGTKAAYGWAKDAAGNVSASRTASVTITLSITSSISTTVSVPTAVSTISIAGVSSPLVCGIDLRVSYPNGTTYVNGVRSGVTPVGTSLVPLDIRLLEADVTIFGSDGFGSGEIAKINYSTVPAGSVSTNFGVTILKVFDCNGLRIQ